MESLPTNYLILLGIGSALPVVVAKVTAWNAPNYVRNVINLGLATAVSGVNQAVITVQDDQSWGWGAFFTGILVTWAMSAFSYMKVWKGLPVTATVQKAGGVAGGSPDYVSVDAVPIKAEGSTAPYDAATEPAVVDVDSGTIDLTDK